jgi:PKD repeat protein
VLIVTCDASGSQRAATYTFDFGDGASDSGGDAVVSHAYAAAGSYGITLTVIDALGRIDSTSRTVPVS